MKKSPRFAAACVAILASSPLFAAEGQAFLSSQKAASVLADGLPWSADTPDGKTLKFTLKQDGTGSIRGPMPFTLSVTWAVKVMISASLERWAPSAFASARFPEGFRAGTGTSLT